MIRDFLENLKGDNKLTNYVINHYIDESSNYTSVDELLKSMEDLQEHGCISGMINELMYYDDTSKFFDEYKDEINEIVSDLIQNSGFSLEGLFGSNFDKNDPLIIDYYNKNLLAWFSFEEVSNKIYEEVKEKLKNQEFGYEC